MRTHTHSNHVDPVLQGFMALEYFIQRRFSFRNYQNIHTACLCWCPLLKDWVAAPPPQGCQPPLANALSIPFHVLLPAAPDFPRTFQDQVSATFHYCGPFASDLLARILLQCPLSAFLETRESDLSVLVRLHLPDSAQFQDASEAFIAGQSLDAPNGYAPNLLKKKGGY